MFAALRERNFRLYWIGIVAYVLGWNTEYVAYNWLTWELTHDPLYLGYLGLAQGLPVFLFQIFGGVLADRVKRLPLLVISQLFSGVMLSTAFVLTVTGWVRVEHLLVLSTIGGVFRAFEQPTRMALLPYVIRREDWANATALGALPWQSGRIVGPSVGGIAIAVFGAAAGFALSASLYFLAIWLYARIRLAAEEKVSSGRSMLVLSTIGGVFRAFEQPTRMALLPYVIRREDWANATALGALPWQSGRIVGPSVGGIAIAVFGAAAGFALSASLYFLAIWLYARIRLAAEEKVSSGRSMLGHLVEGFAFVYRNHLYGGLIALTFFNSLFGMSYVTLLPVFAGEYLHAGSGGYGVLQAASGIGAVIGTLVLAMVSHRIRRGQVLLAGATTLGLGLVAFSQTPSMLFAVAVLAVAGYGNAFFNTLVMTVLQESVPNALRGRVLGIYGLAWNLIPLGGILAGALAAAVDARFAVLFGGCMVAGTAVLMLGFAKGLRSI